MHRLIGRIVRSAVVLATAGALVQLGLPAQAGFIDEFTTPTASSYPEWIAPGPDGKLWFTEFAGNKIASITTSGKFTEFAIPTPSSAPIGIVAGPDGALWFTEKDGNKIGRITTSGTITELTVPTAGSKPYGIAVGPDKALWFAELGGNKLGRVTTGGSFTEFPVLTSNSGPFAIAAGPDGNLWFTEGLANQIGRITTSGTVTEFPINAAGDEPEGIAPGPDGNLWFGEAAISGTDYVGRITTTGTVTLFATPTQSSSPFGIAPAWDGNLWFTEGLANKIGTVSTSGNFTEFGVPKNGIPSGVAPGPDCNIWFAEQANRIDRANLVPNDIVCILILSSALAPSTAKAPGLGATSTWLNMNAGMHGVADSSGMGLFESEVIPIGSTYRFTFIGAGTYSYDDPFDATIAGGKVKVPISVVPLPGAADHAQVTWASAPAPFGFAFDAQVKVPGATRYVNWRTGQLGTGDVFGPGDPLWAGPGTYSFRARMKNTSNTMHSGWSKGVPIALG